METYSITKTKITIANSHIINIFPNYYEIVIGAPY